MLPQKKSECFLCYTFTLLFWWMKARVSSVVKGLSYKEYISLVHLSHYQNSLSVHASFSLGKTKGLRGASLLSSVPWRTDSSTAGGRSRYVHLATQHAVQTDYWRLGRWSSWGFAWVAKQKQDMQAICFITFSESLRRPRNKKDCQFKESLKCEYFLSHKQLKSIQKKDKPVKPI